MITERERHAVAQADEGLRQRFQQHHVEQDAQPRGAHDLGGEKPRLARIHHAIGDVEQDHQNRAERRDRNLRLVADAEQHQEQREHGRSGSRAEKVDDEFERAVDLLRGAEHNAERDGDHGRDQRCRRRAVNGLDEIEAERAAVHALPQRLEGRDRRRQQHRIDPLRRESPATRWRADRRRR